jgi:hypothetical protein
MFEAIVILLYLLWAGVIILFLGFVSSLVFICFIFSVTLFGGAFLLARIDGIFAGMPLAIYAALLLGLAILIKVFSDPAALRVFVRDLLRRMRAGRQKYLDKAAS